jgi:hypothetical protein
MRNDDSPETPELEKVSSDPPNKWLPGRPDAYQIVKDAVKEVGPKSRVAVLGMFISAHTASLHVLKFI